MGVAVLPPQDHFRNHHYHHQRQLISPTNKPRPNPNPNPNPNRSSRRRRNSPPPPPAAGGPPVVGQIRILKRGEDLCPPVPAPVNPDKYVCPARPEVVPVLDGFYAGSAFFTSPPPSSVPLPAFFTGRRNCGMSEARDPVAESVLRRVLKLQ